jgi:hypothetical protein
LFWYIVSDDELSEAQEEFFENRYGGKTAEDPKD